MIAYQMLQMTLGFRDKPWLTLVSTINPSSQEEKVEPKYSSSSGLSRHNIYPSWININIFWSMDFSKKPIKIFTSKMPHSNFKERYHLLKSEVAKCPCGKTFVFRSDRDIPVG